MRILMVSPYPPKRDGIATYAVQAVAALQAEGHDVEVLSPEPSAAHLHLDFHSGARFGLALARRVAAYDLIVVQWHPAFFYRSSEPQHRIAVDVALAVAFRRAKRVEVWMHEYEYDDARGSGPRARAARALFRSADSIHFHSETEREQFLEVVPVERFRTTLAEHGASFIRHSQVSREAARASLGLPADETVFLCIGFIQEHKGFDRAIRSFAGLAAAGCRLDIVGSTRLDEPDFVAHLTELERLCAATPGAHLHEGFVSDEAFDRWIIASDVVVLPYRHIWSSGVLERATLYDRPVIATKVGGLAEQAAGRSVTFVDDDAGLTAAIRAAAGNPEPAAAEPAVELDPDHLFESVQAAVRDRAGRERGRWLAAASSAPVEASSDGGPAEPVPAAPGRAGLAVRRLPPFGKPPATSSRPGVSQLKQGVRRITDWEIDPVVRHVHHLQQAVLASLDALEQRVAALEARPGDGPPPGSGPVDPAAAPGAAR